MADVQVDVMEAGPITAGQVDAAALLNHLNQPGLCGQPGAPGPAQ